MLMAPSENPDVARLWPEGLGGVRQSDSLFLDVFGAATRNPRLRPLITRAFRAHGAEVWEVRFPGAADIVIPVDAAAIAARRWSLAGAGKELPDGDALAAFAYARLLDAHPEALGPSATGSVADQVRRALRCLLGSGVVTIERTVGEPGLSAVLDQDMSLRLLFAVPGDAGAGPARVQVLGRVGVGANWVELIDPSGRGQRHDIAINDFRRRFGTVMVASVAPGMAGAVGRSARQDQLRAQLRPVLVSGNLQKPILHQSLQRLA